MTGTRIAATLLILIFNGGLLFALKIDTGVPVTNCTYYVLNYTHLPDTVLPQSYKIQLIIENGRNIFEGEISIDIEVTRPASTISFHARNLVIRSNMITLVRRIFEREVRFGLAGYSYCAKTQMLFLLFHRDLPIGSYTLHMEYKGLIDNNLGLVRTKYINDRGDAVSYVTILEQTGARRVFPCWDEPKFKATFNITVVYPVGMQAFSMVPYEKEVLVAGTDIMKIFTSTPIMSTYLVTIVIFDHDGSLSEIRRWFTSYMPDETRELLQKIVSKVDQFFLDLTENMWVKLPTKVIAYPNLPSKIAGCWGNILIRANDLYYKETNDFPGRLIDVWKLVTEGMALQYIDNFVSPTQWSHMWFNKALKLYLTYNILGQDFEKMMQLYVVQVLQPALHNDDTLNVPPLTHEYDPIYATLIYKKASIMIRTLERLITKEVLYKAIAKYLWEYAYNSATPNDFFRIVDMLLDQRRYASKYNITEIISTWSPWKHYPTVLITQEGTVNRNFTMGYEIRDADDEILWALPLTYTTQKESLYDQNIFIWWLDETSSEVSGDTIEINTSNGSEWIIVNLQQFGYYRVNYDNVTWFNIGRFLYHNDHRDIHVLNRAQIVDDAYHFLMEDKISLSSFVQLIAFLRKETDFIVWHSVMNVLQYMSPFFNFPESKYFKNYMLDMMSDVLAKIGYNEGPQEKMLEATRLLLLNWVCKHGGKRCRQEAYNRLNKFLAEPKTYQILPWWQDWAYCAGLMNTTYDIWIKAQNHILYTYDHNMVQYLACNEDDAMLKELLAAITFKFQSKWTRLESTDLIKLYHAIVKKHTRRDNMLDFILKKFNVIVLGYLSKFGKLADIMMSVYSKCQLDKILKFIRDNPIWSGDTLVMVKRWSTIRLNQISRQKDMFVRRLSQNTNAKEC